jgi:hypothetical protein
MQERNVLIRPGETKFLQSVSPKKKPGETTHKQKDRSQESRERWRP